MKPTQRKPQTQLQPLTKLYPTEPIPGPTPPSVELSLDRSTTSTASSIARIGEAIWDFYVNNNRNNINNMNNQPQGQGIQGAPINPNIQPSPAIQRVQPHEVNMQNYVPLQVPPPQQQFQQQLSQSSANSMQPIQPIQPPPANIPYANAQASAMMAQFPALSQAPAQPIPNTFQHPVIPSYWTMPNQMQIPIMMPNTGSTVSIETLIENYIRNNNMTDDNVQDIAQIDQLSIEKVRQTIARLRFEREVKRKETDKMGHIINVIKYLNFRIMQDCDGTEIKELLAEQQKPTDEEHDNDIQMAGSGITLTKFQRFYR